MVGLAQGIEPRGDRDLQTEPREASSLVFAEKFPDTRPGIELPQRSQERFINTPVEMPGSDRSQVFRVIPH